jgi:hypothetical protein
MYIGSKNDDWSHHKLVQRGHPSPMQEVYQDSEGCNFETIGDYALKRLATG